VTWRRPPGAISGLISPGWLPASPGICAALNWTTLPPCLARVGLIPTANLSTDRSRAGDRSGSEIPMKTPRRGAEAGFESPGSGRYWTRINCTFLGKNLFDGRRYRTPYRTRHGCGTRGGCGAAGCSLARPVSERSGGTGRASRLDTIMNAPAGVAPPRRSIAGGFPPRGRSAPGSSGEAL
jgi:hypothetical protein